MILFSIYLFQELLSQLEDNLQNVSAKALSSQAICNANQVKLDQIEEKIKSSGVQASSSQHTEPKKLQWNLLTVQIVKWIRTRVFVKGTFTVDQKNSVVIVI